uniref:WD_REPEATS_REGION domain-containing protein n=1 Tax=Angiostrongylus cantonensis TaxID=6313 RepID=A0A0K0DGF6_ANGCA
MASAVNANGGKVDVDSETKVASSRGSWNVGGFVEDVRLGMIQGYLKDFHNDVFRIGAKKFGAVHQKDILGHTGCVNAVEFNKSEILLASGGDDMRVFVWRVADLMVCGKPKPAPIDYNIMAAAREGGMVSFYDRRETREGCFSLVDKGQLFRGQYNPANALLFATASSRGVRLYDLRHRRKPLLDLKDFVSEAIYVEWNSIGTAITALQSHSDPIYIDLAEHRKVELKDPQYSNVHTIKSITFMDDNTIVTGSDDFNVYAWRVPGTDNNGEQSSVVSKATFVLKGHRSIVNHVRYSRSNRIIASCGVEKIIKVWSSIPIPFSYDKPRIREKKTFPEFSIVDATIVPDDTAEDLNMLNYFDQLESFSRMRAINVADGGVDDDLVVGLENYVVNVEMEGLRAHLMGLETSDESNDSDGNDYDVTLADDDGDGGDAEDEDTLRGSLRVEPGPSPSRDAESERRETDTTTTDEESEGPRKRLRRDYESSDSSDNEFSVCDGGIPVNVWPVRRSRSPESQS